MEDRAHPAADGPHVTVSRGRLVMILVGVMLGMLFAMLGQTIVSTAMPRVVAELGGLQHYAWVFTGYMLASTVTVPIYGTLSDRYGRRPFFLLGMVLFLVGSALSGLSRDMAQLIASRAVQGLGAGAMLPITQAIIGDLFPPAERGKWQGLLMAVFGLAAIIGPLAGGWITDHWGWRWAFYVNMPVGVLALLTAGFALPGQVRRTENRIDYRGAALLVAAAVPMLLALSWAGTEYAWASAQIVGLLAFAALMWAAFLVAEVRAAEPIISPSLFSNRVFTVSVGATFLVGGGLYGAIMFLPLFVQGVIGESATNAGAVLTPMMLGFVVGSAAGGQLMSRTGRYKTLAVGGFAVGAAGMFLLSRLDATATTGLVIRNMIVTGLGIGVTMSLFTIVVQNAFPPERLGQVTAGLQFFRSLGGAIGVAVLGTVMANRFQDGLAGRLPAGLAQVLPSGATASLGNSQALLNPAATGALQQRFAALGSQGQVLFDQFLDAVRASLADAITDVFAVGFMLMALGLIATLFLPELPLRKRHPPLPGDVAARRAGVDEKAKAGSDGAPRRLREMAEPPGREGRRDEE